MKFRFGEYVREIGYHRHQVSYSLLAKVEHQRLKLQSRDVYHLLAPYVSVRFFDQLKAVVPLALYLAIFQAWILQRPIADALQVAGGLTAVIIGLMFFMEGLKLGLMPFGEKIGSTLPQKAHLWVVLFLTFVLGVGVTYAEPAIGALQAAGSIVDPARAPLLHSLLNERAWLTVLTVGLSVGAAAVVGTLRFLYNWSLKPLIFWSLIPTLILTVVGHFHPILSQIVGLAWDCGGVTTGPVTVPLVLALGIGVAAAVGKGNASLSGFGIVTLASIFPVMGVLLLGIAVMAMGGLAPTAAVVVSQSWMTQSPVAEVISGLRAIVPLVVFLFLVLKFVLKEKISQAGILRYGIFLSLLGMVIFNLGLTYGLAKLGDQSGSLLPAAFSQLPEVAGSPLYPSLWGVLIAIVFAWILGFGATLAEPALHALGMTVENLTSGAFKKSTLMGAVSFGVATGIAIGVLKIIYDLPLTYFLIPAYALAVLLTILSTEEYVNVAWDSAGVTTGPVTVPLVLALGLGLGRALNMTEGFGILAAASVCPILSVLVSGIYVHYRAKKLNEKIEGKVAA